MNETNQDSGPSDTSWPNRVPQVRVSGSSMLSGSENAAPAAEDLLNTAAQGAHETIDRIVGSAAPTVRKLGEGVSAARQTLHNKTDQWREAGDEWVEGARTTVRGSPLVSVAAAFALGAVMARLTR